MSNEERHELDPEIREIFARGDVGRHPSYEQLAAYARGELPESEAERLQEHLGPCRECTAAVLAFEFPRLEAAAADRLPDSEVAADVEAIVAGAGQATVGPRRGEHGSRGVLAFAAMLAVACLALAILAARLGRQVGELEDALRSSRAVATRPEAIAPPQTGVPIVDLYPAGVARGEAAAPRPIQLGGDAAMVALILTPPSGLRHDAYAVRIFAADGELWRGPARANEAGAFVVVLPRRFAEAGAHRIVLYGTDATREQLLETYPTPFEL